MFIIKISRKGKVYSADIMFFQIYFIPFLWLQKTHGHIVRLQCFETGEFSVVKSGLAISGHVFKSFEDLEVENCRQQCLLHPLCKSINTKNEGGVNCQLNSKSAANPFDLAALSASPGWTFRSTNYSESNVGELCLEEKPCPIGMTCKPTCVCPGYQCVVSEPGPFKSCADAYSQGFRETKAYQIDLPNIGVIGVRCDMTTDGGGWIVFQRRIDNTVDFHRNWKDYKNGFGDLDGNFWLGLDKLHQLAGPGKQAILRVDLKHMDHISNKFAKYNTFIIASESDDYRLTVEGYTGDAGHSLESQNGMTFSTKDHDTDIADWNCAGAYFGGWWYRRCHFSNLNGKYPPDNNESATYMSWHGIELSFGRITFSEIKIKLANV